MAATSSTRSESPAEIDFSVIRTSINMGHKQIDQILNGIHYGSEEVRHLLREECDFIMECKVCRNLFRSFPNFVAHKRVYCMEYYEEKVVSEKMDSQSTSQETVIIQPEAPEDSRKNAENAQNKIGSTAQSNTDKVIRNTFEGKSKDYQFYTKVAEEVERRKLTKVSNTVTLTSIPTNSNAVTMSVSKGENSNLSASTSSPKKQSPVKSNSQSVPSSSIPKQKMSVLNICASLAEKKMSDEKSKSSSAGVVTLRLSQRQRKSSPRKSLDYVDLTRKVNQNKSNSPIETNEEPEAMEWTDEESSKSLNDPKNDWLKFCDSKNLKCRVCDQEFSSLNKLHFHVKIKHVNEASRCHCPVCPLSYEHFKSLARHLRTFHHKPGSFINMIKNKHAQKSADQSKQIKFLKKPDSPEKPAETVVSQKSSETVLSQKPSETSDSQKPSETLICPVCHRSYEHLKSLTRHVRTIHDKPESLINMIKNKYAQKRADQSEQNMFLQKSDSSEKPSESLESQKPSGTFVSLSTGWKKCDKCGKVCWKAKSFYRHYASCKGASNKMSPASSKAGSPVKQDKPANGVQRNSTALLRLEEKLRAGVTEPSMENTQSTTRSRSRSRERKSLEKSIENKTNPLSELCKALTSPPLSAKPLQKPTDDASTMKEAVQNKALGLSTINRNEKERQGVENQKKIVLDNDADSNIEMDFETSGSPGFKELQDKLTREAGIQQPSTDKNNESEANNRPYGTRLSSQKKEIPKVNDSDTPSRKISNEADKDGSLSQVKGQRMQRETAEMKELELKLTRKALGHKETEREDNGEEKVDTKQKESTKITDNQKNRCDTNTDPKKISSTFQTVQSSENKLAEKIDQTSAEAKSTKMLRRSDSRDASSRRQLVAENLREKMEVQEMKNSNKVALSRSVSQESVSRKQSISERTPEKLQLNIDKTPVSSPRRTSGLPVSPTPSNQSASGDGYNLKFKMTVKEMAELVETASLTKFAKDRKKKARKILNKKQVKEAQKVSASSSTPALRQKTKQVSSNKVQVVRTRSRSVENKQPAPGQNKYSLRATGSSEETKTTSNSDTKKVDSSKEKIQENTKLSREQKRLQNSEGFVEKNYYAVTASRESSKDRENEVDSEKRHRSRERHKTENSSERNLSYESDTSVGSSKRLKSRERRRTDNPSVRSLYYESDTSVTSSVSKSSEKADKDFLDKRSRVDKHIARELKRLEASAGFVDKTSDVTLLTSESVQPATNKGEKSTGPAQHAEEVSQTERLLNRELKRLEASPGFVDKTSDVTLLTSESVQPASNKGEKPTAPAEHAEDLSQKERLLNRELKRLEASGGFVDKTSNVPLLVSENVQAPVNKGENPARPIQLPEEVSQKERLLTRELKRLEASTGFVDKNANNPLLKSPMQAETSGAEKTTEPKLHAEEITQKEKHLTRELRRLEASPGFVDKNADDAQLQSAEVEPTNTTKTKRNIQMETVRIKPANVPSKEASPSLKDDKEIIILDDDKEVIAIEDGKEIETIKEDKEIVTIEDDKEIIILDDDRSLDIQPKTDVTTRKMMNKVGKSCPSVNNQQETSATEKERSKELKKVAPSKQKNNPQEKHKIEASLKINPLKRKATDSAEVVPMTQVNVVKELNLKQNKSGKAANKTQGNELAKTVRSEKKVHNVEKLQTIASKHVLKIKERFFQIQDTEPSPGLAHRTETAETRKLKEIEKEIAIGLSKVKPSAEKIHVAENKQKRDRHMKPIVLTVNRDIGAYLKAFCNTPPPVRYDVSKNTEKSETKKSTEIVENEAQVKSTSSERRSSVGSSIYGITVGLTKAQAQNTAKKGSSVTHSGVDSDKSKINQSSSKAINTVQDNKHSDKEAFKGKPDSQKELSSSEETSSNSELPKHRTRLATGSIYFDSELLKLSPFKAGKKVAEQGKTVEDTGKVEGLTLVKKRLTLSPKKNEQEMKAKHSRTQSTPLRYSLETGVKKCDKCGKTFWKKKAFVFHMKNSMCSDKRSSKIGVKRPRSPEKEENNKISDVSESEDNSSKKPKLDVGSSPKLLSNKDESNLRSNEQEVSNKSIPIETISRANEQIGKETVIKEQLNVKQGKSFNSDKGEDNEMCHTDKEVIELDKVDVKTKQRDEETPGPSTSQLAHYEDVHVSDDDNESDFSGFSEDDLKSSEQELSQINPDEQSDGITDDVEDLGSSEGSSKNDTSIDLDPEPTKQFDISPKGKRPVRKSAQNRFGHVEEIWVYKEPGKPIEIEKQKFVKNREYVVDVKNPSKLHCHNIKDVDKLIDEEKLKCKQCDTPCTSISNLRRHVIRHLGWKRYKCKHCTYTCYDMSYCRQHVLRAHNDNLNSKNFNKYITDLKKEATKKRAAKRTVTLYKTKQKSQDSEVYKKPKVATTNEIVADTDKHIPVNRKPLFKKSPGHVSGTMSEVQKSPPLVSSTTEKAKEPKKVSVADFIGKSGNTEQNVSRTRTLQSPEKSLTPLSRARMILAKALGD